MLPHADKPTLILDTERCKRNIERMCRKAEEHDLEFRPHFKTHQSGKIGNWFRDHLVSGITVSSPSMGHYFADFGWDDITIAFPFYPGMLPELHALEQKASLRLFIHDAEHLQLIDRDLNNRVHVYIEIDAGYGRSGIPAGDHHRIEQLISAAESSNNAFFHGFYIHDGGTYAARGEAEINEKVTSSANALTKLKSDFPHARISLGDTPSASKSNRIGDMDEITPGNFVFYDWTQVQIGSCELNDVALFAQLPVAQAIAGGKKAILHGGAVHLSKDLITIRGRITYGQPVHLTPDSVDLIGSAYLSALSQEHGTLSGYDYVSDNVITICPVHSCLTANLFDHYTTTEGHIIEKRTLS